MLTLIITSTLISEIANVGGKVHIRIKEMQRISY